MTSVGGSEGMGSDPRASGGRGSRGSEGTEVTTTSHPQPGLGRTGAQAAYELGRRADRGDAEAVIMPGGNWPAMSVVERLERELGKPVLANNAVSLWAGLRLLQRGEPIAGHGLLLREHLAD